MSLIALIAIGVFFLLSKKRNTQFINTPVKQSIPQEYKPQMAKDITKLKERISEVLPKYRKNHIKDFIKRHGENTPKEIYDMLDKYKNK